MDNALKKKSFFKPCAAVFLFVGITVLIAATTSAWEVAVDNSTEFQVGVTLNYWVKNSEEVKIGPGQTYVFHTGAYCLDKLRGWIFDPGNYANVPVTLREGDCNSDGVCCESSSWRICRKRGDGKIRDDDFGFCKRD